MPLNSSVFFVIIMSLFMVACGQREVSYRRDVSPILKKNCSVCHSAGGVGYEKSGFSVDSYQDVMRGTRYGRVISPGSSVGSTLVRLIKHEADSSVNMPKKYKVSAHNAMIMPESNARWLPSRDIELITQWVDQGAKDN